ncbi:MAG: phytoene/squalene synthase family protein [Pseudonocardia sp.]|nr:phytoene/squalene synthase family protein [Pseudonocardia sp.]
MAGSSVWELDAAGITSASLRSAYRYCKTLNAIHGRTFYLATRLLAPAQRPFVHALYGFARYADEVVDARHNPRSAAAQAAELNILAANLSATLDGQPATNPVLVAVADTARRYQLNPAHFEAFLDSMRMDIEVCSYSSFDELGRYMYGSAAAIGLQMLPVLGTSVPRELAEPAAAALGIAFQLTNFLRDVGEDLDRNRVYLPADELAAFGVDLELLRWCHQARRTERRVRRALAHQVARTLAVYRRAAPGIAQLAPRSRPCIRTAFVLYSGILDQIVNADYDVFSGRASVPIQRRLAVALPQLALAQVTRLSGEAPFRTP